MWPRERVSARRASLLVFSLLSSSASGHAEAEPACAAPTLNVLLPPDDPRQALALQLSEQLRTLSDVDRCARVTLQPHDAELELLVQSGDGRRASRVIRNAAELRRASEALLTLPPVAQPVPLPPSPLELPPQEAELAPQHDAGVHLELGFGLSTRLGGSPLFLSGGATAFADVVDGAWLLQISGRADITGGLLTQPTLSDYYLAATALGVGLGRRFDYRPMSLDLLLGPQLVLEAQDADDGDLDVHASSSDVRVDLSARLSGPRSSSWRVFGGVDFELSPAHVGRQRSSDPALPAFPSWTCGLSLGVLWSASEGVAAGVAPQSRP